MVNGDSGGGGNRAPLTRSVSRLFLGSELVMS